MDKEDVTIYTHTHTQTHIYIYNGMVKVKIAKKNEIMSFAAIWMDMEIIILSEVSHKKKDKYHMISHEQYKI